MKMAKIVTITIVISSLLAACSNQGSSGNTSSPTTPPTTPQSSSPPLSINEMTAVPVVNGTNTAGKIYIHNNGSHNISGIKISLQNATDNNALKAIPKPQGSSHNSSIADGNGFQLINPDECTTVKAGMSCAVDFVTPNLTVGQRNSAVIMLNYTDATKSLQHKSIVNYQYVNSSTLNGVNFYGGSVTAVGNTGSIKYVTSYLLGGGASGTIYNNVNLQIDNIGAVGLTNGFVNGNQVAAGQVIPVEFLVKFNSNKPTIARVTPTYGSTAQTVKASQALRARNPQKHSWQNGQSGNSLLINLTPSQESSNLIFSNLPLLNLASSTTATVTVVNNGNADVAAGSFTVTDTDGGTHVAITNGCTGSIPAYANGSCNITFTVNDATITGSDVVTYKVSTNAVGSDTLYYKRNNAFPALTIAPAPSAISMMKSTGESTVTFTVTNTGIAPLTGISLSSQTTGNGITGFNNISGTCGISALNATFDLGAGSFCTVIGTYTAGSNIGYGYAYLQANVTYAGNSYSYSSLPVSYTITGSPELIFTNPAAGQTPDIITDANGFESTSYTFTVKNNGAESAIFTSYSLVPEGSQASAIPVIDTVNSTCSQTGTLASSESCNIVVKYGPIAATSSTNESGTLAMTINYHGGIPDTAYVESTQMVYHLVGNDSYVGVEFSGLGTTGGDGTSATPYATDGHDSTTQGITLTYTNYSQNYDMKNFNVNTNNLQRGLQASGGSCPTGSVTGTLAKGNSCTLELTVNKADYQTIAGSTTFGGLVNFPQASWWVDTVSGTPQGGFYLSGALKNAAGATGFYLNYTQAQLASSLSNNNNEFVSTDLTMVVTNATGYATFDGMVTGVSSYLESAPLSVSGGCTISGSYGVSCPLWNGTSATSGVVTYIMPTYFVSTSSTNIPLVFSSNSSGFVYLSPAYMFIKYNKN
jgi:hypothetical protein